MTLPAVVVLDVPAQLAADLGTVAVRGCSVTLGSRCAARQDAANAPSEALAGGWLAILTSPDEPSTLIRVELRPISRPFAITAVRDLVFRPSDTVSERWATAGVVVAALVIQAESGMLSPSDVPSESPSPKDVPEPEKKPQRASLPAAVNTPHSPVLPPAERASGSVPRVAGPVRLDLLGMVGPSLQRSPWRVGGESRLSVTVAETPLFGWVSVSAATSTGDVAVTDVAGGFGGGVTAEVAENQAFVEVRAGVSAAALYMAAEQSGQRASAMRWQSGPLGGADFIVRTTDHLSLMVGGTAAARRPRVTVEVAGEPARQQLPLDVAFSCGVRWHP